MLLFFLNSIEKIAKKISDAEFNLEKLEEANPDDHAIIAANMGLPEVSAFGPAMKKLCGRSTGRFMGVSMIMQASLRSVSRLS
ncbi:MAG: hypothetical protein ACD_74C00158G0003 [uncultured bacterium]|jgi:hypothetical protein|nr:MAG: hypothetical protein ACD_74C00158G0003 [uncultured bacterium]